MLLTTCTRHEIRESSSGSAAAVLLVPADTAAAGAAAGATTGAAATGLAATGAAAGAAAAGAGVPAAGAVVGVAATGVPTAGAVTGAAAGVAATGFAAGAPATGAATGVTAGVAVAAGACTQRRANSSVGWSGSYTVIQELESADMMSVMRECFFLDATAGEDLRRGFGPSSSQWSLHVPTADAQLTCPHMLWTQLAATSTSTSRRQCWFRDSMLRWIQAAGYESWELAIVCCAWCLRYDMPHSKGRCECLALEGCHNNPVIMFKVDRPHDHQLALAWTGQAASSTTKVGTDHQTINTCSNTGPRCQAGHIVC